MLNRRNLLTRLITATLVWLGLKPAEATPAIVKMGRSVGKTCSFWHPSQDDLLFDMLYDTHQAFIATHGRQPDLCYLSDDMSYAIYCLEYRRARRAPGSDQPRKSLKEFRETGRLFGARIRRGFTAGDSFRFATAEECESPSPHAPLEFRVSGPWVDVYRDGVYIAMMDEAYGEPSLLATGHFTRLSLAEMAQCAEFYRQRRKEWYGV